LQQLCQYTSKHPLIAALSRINYFTLIQRVTNPFLLCLRLYELTLKHSPKKHENSQKNAVSLLAAADTIAYEKDFFSGDVIIRFIELFNACFR
jgi:hypothetical protein